MTGARPPTGPPAQAEQARRVRRFYRVPLEEIAYLRVVVESYEGLAQLTALPGRAEVEWTIPVELAEEAAALARALAAEITLVPIPRPDDWPD